jgi:hypothetical protein
MGILMRWGGIFLGALSLFSLAQKLWNFGLAPIFKEALNFYRVSLYPVAEMVMTGLAWLLSHFSLSLPLIPQDGVILYILCSVSIVAFELKQMNQLQKDIGSLTVYVFAIFLLFAWPLTIVINIFGLCFSTKLGIRDIFLGWDAELARLISVFIIMFSYTSYLLTQYV